MIWNPVFRDRSPLSPPENSCENEQQEPETYQQHQSLLISPAEMDSITEKVNLGIDISFLPWRRWDIATNITLPDYRSTMRNLKINVMNHVVIPPWEYLCFKFA